MIKIPKKSFDVNKSSDNKRKKDIFISPNIEQEKPDFRVRKSSELSIDALMGILYVIVAVISFFILYTIDFVFKTKYPSFITYYLLIQVIMSGVIVTFLSAGMSKFIKLDFSFLQNFGLGVVLSIYSHFLIWLTWNYLTIIYG